MMAVFSPKTQSIAFEPPETISIEVAGEGNLTETNQIQIWSNTMMKWRGECFLTAGLSKITSWSSTPWYSISTSCFRSCGLPVCHFARHHFPPISFSVSVMERVCLHSVQFGMVVPYLLLRSWPLLRVAIHQRPKLWHPVLFSSMSIFKHLFLPKNSNLYPVWTQYVMYIPGLTILLKIPLILPGISCYLEKIRSGYERHSVFDKVVVDIKPAHQETWTAVTSKEKSQGVLLPSFFKHSNSVTINTRTT
jgi:hypothetical protein